MKKYLNIVSVIAFTLFSLNSIAQKGIRLSTGVVHSNTVAKGYTYSGNYEMEKIGNWTTGLHLGLTADLPLSTNLFFETGILLTQKGLSDKWSSDEFGDEYKVKETIKIGYGEIPLHLKYYTPVGNSDNKLYLLAGPYFSTALFGSYRYVEEIDGEKESDYDIGGMGGFFIYDFGIDAGIGIEMNKVQLGFQYGQGLKAHFIDDEMSHQTMMINLKYKL